MKGESLVYFYGRLFGIVLSLIVVTAHSESLFLDPKEDCCPDGLMVKPGTSNSNCSCIYPIKIGLLLDNVSANFINSSSEFQHEVSSQLGLADVQIVITAFDYISTNTLNISLDIGPIKGVSFNLVEAAMIRQNLYDHKVQFDPSLVGDYTVLSFRQMVPEAPPPSATISTPPAYAPSPHAFSGAMPLAGKLPVFQKSNNNPRWILIVVIVSAMGLVVCCLFLYWRCVVSVKGENIIQSDEKGKVSLTVTMLDSKKEFEPLLQPTGVKLFSYVTLKEATNNFDAANLLGEGGFGRVYCGILKDGTLIAVKKLTTGSQQGDREFLVEVELLSRLHHRNLVKLLGYFSSHDSTQQLLCYELVPNGSLESWLHGPLGANNPLSWEQRMRIAIGAARGLAYLHEDSQPCVIHRDFKASNILLENNFHAKVSDFGLAKLAPDGHCNPLSTRVMGTFGYVAPEYAMTGHLLVKCDVYSYGVVLLELLSGRKPVDMSQPPGQQNLVTWARPLFKDTTSLEELADPRLEDKYPIEGFAQVAAIAAACVAPEPNQRPSMGEVVQSLKMVQHSSERSISGDPEAMMKGPVSTSIDGSFLTLPTNGTESGTFESDSSSVISSGHLNVFSIFDHENVLEPKVLSEDLTEGFYAQGKVNTANFHMGCSYLCAGKQW